MRWWSTRRGPTGHLLIAAIALLAASCSPNNGPYRPKPGTSYDPDTGLPLEIISAKDNAEMVLVRAGAWKKGRPNGTVRRTRINAFYIDKYEVTNEAYHRFVSAEHWAAPLSAAPDAALFSWTDGHYPQGRGRYPVVLVSFEDAAAYADWAGKKLPTQEQWEYAARGTRCREFPWGSVKLPPADCNTADRLAGRELFDNDMWQEWYTEWAKQEPAKRNAEALKPVGTFPKDVSPFGCFDLGGNVSEWCVKTAEMNHANGHGSEMPETVAPNGHVTCGGSWLKPAGATRAWRYDAVASAPYYDVGFRCVVPASHPAIQALARAAEVAAK